MHFNDLSIDGLEESKWNYQDVEPFYVVHCYYHGITYKMQSQTTMPKGGEVLGQ